MLAIFGRKGPKRVLNAVAQLAQNILGDIARVLRYKIDPHPFGTDQARNLFDLVNHRFWCAVKQQVGLVKEQHQFGFVGIAHFGQFLE